MALTQDLNGLKKHIKVFARTTAAIVLIFAATAVMANAITSNRIGRMPVPKAKDSIVIFATHPDDEMLGSGGYIEQAVAAGAKLRVVLVTNGEYDEQSSANRKKSSIERKRECLATGEVRQEESATALGMLGVPKKAITFLGYPNYVLGDMWQPKHWLASSPVQSTRLGATKSPFPNSFTPQAVYCGESLLDDIERVLIQEKPNVVISMNPSDLHNDHWPTYAFTRFALNELASEGLEFTHDCRLYTYLIHRNPWPSPRGNRPFLRLGPPTSLASQYDWFSLPLTHAQTREKGEAISLYKTQGGDTHPFMRAFVRANDLYAVANAQDWPAYSTMSPIEIIRKPAGGFRNGSADIVSVSLSRKEQRMTVKIETREAIDPSIGFHFSIHAGENSRQDRIIAQFDYEDESASGLELVHGDCVQIPPSSIKCDTDDNAATLDIPYPLNDRDLSFFLFRAWTTINGHEADKTATATMTIQPVYN